MMIGHRVVIQCRRFGINKVIEISENAIQISVFTVERDRKAMSLLVTLFIELVIFHV